MVRHFEHVTIAVREIDAAKRFFALLGFEGEISTVIKGPIMDAYMGVPGIEAEHVTLVLKGGEPRLEVQLLRYRQQSVPDEPRLARLDKLGFNHVCFAVDDLVAEVARLEAPEQTRLAPRCFTPDGSRLIAVGVETQALHVWDLGAVRCGLVSPHSPLMAKSRALNRHAASQSDRCARRSAPEPTPRPDTSR